jgi:tRNA pseudouridine55 synthase
MLRAAAVHVTRCRLVSCNTAASVATLGFNNNASTLATASGGGGVGDGDGACGNDGAPGLEPCSVWLVDKPVGVTSHDVVRTVRQALGLPGHVPRGRSRGGTGQRPRVKVGHTGTLDPFCSGLMVVLVGRATKLARFFTALGKEYDCTVALGVTSDTHDLDGVVTSTATTPGATSLANITQHQIDHALASFVGTYAQRVPVYSAVNVGGRRLHEMGRAGEAPPESELPVRNVTITELERLDHGESVETVRIRVACTKGTYIRALARDVGEMLGCGALCAQLRRTKVGRLSVDDSVPPTSVRLTGGLPLAQALAEIPEAERDAAILVMREHLKEQQNNSAS